MEKQILRQVQLVQLEIAKEVKRICEKYHIKYFLDSGTLLGAVRHKGFIPWDDDLDIAMLRIEYEKFLKVAPKELSSQYFLQTWDSDPYYPLAFAKIRKKNTLYWEAAAGTKQKHNEIYIDIFPYDVFPISTFQRFWQGIQIRIYKQCMLSKAQAKPWVQIRHSIIKRHIFHLRCFIFRLFGSLFPRCFIKYLYKKIMVRYNHLSTGFLYEQTGASSYGKWVIPSSCLQSYCDLPFEDIEFSCPNDFDLFLRSVYGNYMQLPPENKRDNRHGIIKIKL